MSKHAEVVHWMNNSDIRAIIPAQVDIDLTNICNQDCFYCNSAEHRAKAPVQKKYTEYITLLDKLSLWRSHTPNSYGSLNTITYPGGGEPTLLPGYEKVLEHTIDLGFLTSITTNGSKLHKLIDNVSVEKIRKLAWIGIDIDAGEPELYEIIRRSLTKTSPFKQVISNATKLVKMGAIVDFKVILNEYNSNITAIENIFKKTKEVGVRLLYFRPGIINGQATPLTPELLNIINGFGQAYGVCVKINQSKTEPRIYNRCHQMFQFPVFCADGEIYVCCDNKGNPQFSIGRWDQGDFRDLWLNKQHMSIYNQTNTHLCPPCRPNSNNNRIQEIINDPSLLEVMYT
jgi:sulfatase maturation enzyme AslB (radical SAM superfamily)